MVHGNMPREIKEEIMKLFLNPEHDDDQSVSILCATSGVGNVGVDSPSTKSFFRIDCPTSTFDVTQESGRAGRVENSNPLIHSCNMFYSIESFILLFERTMNPENHVIDDSYRHEQIKYLIIVRENPDVA